jgi:hypothetical protein
MADVLGVRDRLRANGVTNPRSKGGGRLRESGHYPTAVTAIPPIAAETVRQIETTPEQKVFVPARAEQQSEPESAQPVIDLDQSVENHPAARQAVGRAVGELIRRHLPTEIRQQVAERLGQLAAQGDDASWLPALYQGLVGSHEQHRGEGRAEERERSRNQSAPVTTP